MLAESGTIVDHIVEHSKPRRIFTANQQTGAVMLYLLAALCRRFSDATAIVEVEL
jgi:hypothetical protein